MADLKSAANSVSSYRVVHSVHHPVGAKTFIQPVVEYLLASGFQAELWVQDISGFEGFLNQITVPRRVVPCDFTPNPVALARRVTGYARAIGQRRPLILHCHQTRASTVPLLAGFRSGIPIRIYHNHGLSYVASRGFRRWAMQAVELTNMALATHVLFVSHSTLEQARRDGLLRAKQATVLGPGSIAGIDLRSFPMDAFSAAARRQARTKLGIPQDSFVVGYVGRPVRHKGFHDLLSAWTASRMGQSGAVLLIAGCSQQNVDAVVPHAIAVKALGYLSTLTDFYAACQAIALPSQTEGFPYSLLEGAAAGLCLVACDVPGTRCAVRPFVTGLLLPPGDTAGLGRALRLLAEEPLKCEEMGRRAREVIEKEFQREDILGHLLQYYKTVLAEDSAKGTKR